MSPRDTIPTIPAPTETLRSLRRSSAEELWEVSQYFRSGRNLHPNRNSSQVLSIVNSDLMAAEQLFCDWLEQAQEFQIWQLRRAKHLSARGLREESKTAALGMENKLGRWNPFTTIGQVFSLIFSYLRIYLQNEANQ
jgi:hypothetical protein